MKVFQAHIGVAVAEFLIELVNQFQSYNHFNHEIIDRFGIEGFLNSQEEFQVLKSQLLGLQSMAASQDPVEYGDFQTPKELADKVCRYLQVKNISPEILIEPTCGKGNFILSALQNVGTVKEVYGVEIYKPYIWECKFRLIDYYLKNTCKKKVQVKFFHSSVFDVRFKDFISKAENKEILVLGNPPWVTNSTLSRLNSENLPKKSNFKSHSGMEAITGKGNFDISEYITLQLLEHLSTQNGSMAFLIKNSIIKNIIHDLVRNHYPIGDIEKLTINAADEFNVNVDASLLFCKFNKTPQLQCTERNFYSPNDGSKTFGWVKDKFVSSVDDYQKYQVFDHRSPFEWRSGLKHDCSKIMELTRHDDLYTNKLTETIELEEDLIYELLKGSDLKKKIISHSNRFTLVTQQKIGQNTHYIKEKYPLTYLYLENHRGHFEKRRSSIYKNKPDFSIFGVGEYSFKKYKVAISGLYKNPLFSLIIPEKNKPIVLDDTCYFLGFDHLVDSVYTFLLLNRRETKQFLKSIVFLDMKRVYTKELLMRIDLNRIADSVSIDAIVHDAKKLPEQLQLEISSQTWAVYRSKISIKEETSLQQRSLF